jgi:hypothetical protein
MRIPLSTAKSTILFWGVGGIEVLFNFGVALYLMAEVIQSVQQGLRGLIHAA